MSFREFVSEAGSLVKRACDSLGYAVPSSLDWDIPPSKELGDVSFRAGYQLAGVAKKKPGEVVAELVAVIERDFASNRRYVRSVEGHPSGFLNFRLEPSGFYSDVLASALSTEYGSIDVGKGKSVLIEHTSVNPNKALHVGHLRNVALGDCLTRLLRFTKHDVRVLNYIDDSGLQVADVIVGIKFLGFPSTSTSKKFDHYAGDDIYVQVNKKYETDPSLAEKRKLVLKGIEERNPEIFPLASEVTGKILREQLKTCWRFNASYDLLVFESDIIASKLWDDTFSALKSKQIAKLETEGPLQGCWIVNVKGEKEGEDKVLVRSDGTATYVAKDIPFAALKTGLVKDKFTYEKFILQPDEKQLWRTNSSGQGEKTAPVTWGADYSITAIGSEQSRLQRVILHVLEQLSGEDLSKRYVHVGYALMTLSPKTVESLDRDSKQDEQGHALRMSGRKGLYVNADDVIDAVKNSALIETRKRNPNEDEMWYNDVSEKISISAVRFSLLKQDLDKTITFDLEESLKLIGETGPYMLYSYARASSILSKVIDDSGNVDGKFLSSESEADLATLISKFDLSVEKAVKMDAPKWIAHYSFELCETFNKFYEKNRVLQVEDRNVRVARVALVKAFRNVLRSSLNLLGIECSEKI